MNSPPDPYLPLKKDILAWAEELGFQKTGVTDIHLAQADACLQQWLARGFHGEMEYMQRHGSKRSRPDHLVPGTVRVISCRMNYLPEEDTDPALRIEDPAAAFVSRYALGRDYHKLLRKRLQKLAERIENAIGKSSGYRVFVDSAPVLEKALAEKAGLGWIGKHTNLLDRDAGSWFFLGEIYTSLPLPVDEAVTPHCGDCTACIDICPTQAIVAPYQLDARRCISYLTIELKGEIPEEFRTMIGNRIYGCDDCQQVCPWNRFARYTEESDFTPREGLDSATLLELFSWDEKTFLKKTEGSAIRRIGHERWQRNIAVALGNGEASHEVRESLHKAARETDSTLVIEHVNWALAKLTGR